MPTFLVAAAVQVEADSEFEAVAFAQSIALEVERLPNASLLVPEHPKVEVDPDTIPDPVLRTAEEMEVHPPCEGKLETSDAEWVQTRNQHGIRIDLYDLHRAGKRGLPLFGYRLSWLYTSVTPGHPDNRWEVLFTGEDYEPGPGADDDQTFADLLGFLASYDELTESDATPRQKQWLANYRDELSMWSAELEGEVGHDV